MTERFFNISVSIMAVLLVLVAFLIFAPCSSAFARGLEVYKVVLVGSFNDWSLDTALEFDYRSTDDFPYTLTHTFQPADEFKIYVYTSPESGYYCPDSGNSRVTNQAVGLSNHGDDNFIVDSEEPLSVDIYFLTENYRGNYIIFQNSDQYAFPYYLQGSFNDWSAGLPISRFDSSNGSYFLDFAFQPFYTVKISTLNGWLGEDMLRGSLPSGITWSGGNLWNSSSTTLFVRFSVFDQSDVAVGFSLTDLSLVSVDTSAIYDSGFSSGYSDGLNYANSIVNSSSASWTAGYNAGVASSNDYSFLGLMTAVIDAPVTVFTSLFNFDVLGFNLLGFVAGLLCISIVLFILRKVLK